MRSVASSCFPIVTDDKMTIENHTILADGQNGRSAFRVQVPQLKRLIRLFNFWLRATHAKEATVGKPPEMCPANRIGEIGQSRTPPSLPVVMAFGDAEEATGLVAHHHMNSVVFSLKETRLCK